MASKLIGRFGGFEQDIAALEKQTVRFSWCCKAPRTT